MARLMADVHTAEAVIEINRNNYSNDSLKQTLKQSVYAKHKVTAEQVDSSLAWYGRNITYYMDVYDRTIEILEHRMIESGNRIAAEAALSIAGDSVDVWSRARHIYINDRLPSKTLTFNFSSDPNWERGDIYIWRAKLFNNTENSRWVLVAEYADGTIDYLTQSLAGDGRKELYFQTDSLLEANRLYGFLEGENRHGTTLAIDSIEMIRKRVNHDQYRSKRLAVHKLSRILKTEKNSEVSSDSIATDEK